VKQAIYREWHHYFRANYLIREFGWEEVKRKDIDGLTYILIKKRIKD
jgi:hypothetical protein